MSADGVPGLSRLFRQPAAARRALGELVRRSGGPLAPELADLEALFALLATEGEASTPREVRS